MGLACLCAARLWTSLGLIQRRRMLTHADHADAASRGCRRRLGRRAGWPTWDAELRSASLDGTLALGSRGQLAPVRGRPSRFEIIELDPGGRHVIEVALPLARLRLVRSVARQGRGARVVHSVAFAGPLGGLFARLLEPRFARALPAAVAAVCRQAEANSAATSDDDPSG